jgi:hypothetical protein
MRSRQRTLLVTFWEWICVVATFYDSFFIFVCGMWNRSIYPKRRNPELWWQFSKKQRQQSNKWGPYNVPDGPPPPHPPLLWGPSIYIHPHPFIFPATLYIYTHHTFNRANTSSSSFYPFFLSFFLGGFLMELVTLLMRERARETCWS